jgi:hypothetical protein
MNSKQLVQRVAALGAVLGMTAVAYGDVVETKNGSRLVGTVLSIDGSAVVLRTEYAGDLKVKQDDVVSISTEGQQNIRLASGTVLQGTIAGTGNGAITIAGPDGTLNTEVGKVAATWAPGEKDPAVAALERSWAYEAAVDVTGKSGNKTQLGTAVSARATLSTAQDTLQFYAAYDRQETDDVKSADQLKVGVDYQNNFSGRYSWYVRNEGGFDRIKDIELYNIAAGGVGYDFIKEPKHVLTGRAGLSFRYEGYGDPTIEDVKAFGLDFGINHRYDSEVWSIVNRISYVPLFEDFGNFRILHESYFEIPMADPKWRLRLGLANDYNSEPSPGIDELDTTYFVRLVLNWK